MVSLQYIHTRMVSDMNLKPDFNPFMELAKESILKHKRREIYFWGSNPRPYGKLVVAYRYQKFTVQNFDQLVCTGFLRP